MHLDRLAPLSGREAAAVAAAVAQSLADLHAMGAVHRGVRAEHVAVDTDGAVRLSPPAELGEVAGTPADDIADLGRLLEWLADRAPDRPGRRLPLVAPLPPVAVLRDTAQWCSRSDEHRPSAGAVAATLRSRVPDACFPSLAERVAPTELHQGGTGRRHGRRLALGSVAAVAVAGAVVLPARCADRPAAAGASWADGVLTVGRHRYAVGGPGDDVAISRWRCGGSRAVVLLRAATGDIVLFDRLPTDSRPLAGRVLTRVPGARQLVAGRDRRGCATLAVTDADGRAVPVDVGGGR